MDIFSSMGKEDSDEFNKVSDERNNSNKNILNFYTDENNCVLPNKISGAYSEFHNFIKSNKIPEYARENYIKLILSSYNIIIIL